MRRPSPEWLLAPVFALPLAAAAALVLWARHDYFARIEPYRTDGETLARRRIEREPGRVGWIAAKFSQDLPRFDPSDDGWVPFCHPSGAGYARVEAAHAPQAAWELADAYPSGLRAPALADAGVRLAIETGGAPARQPGADAATASFLALSESPSAQALRSAPLPASTKLYLLRRRFDGKPAEDDEALRLLAAFARVASDARGRWTPGIHIADGVAVLGPGPAGLLVYTEPLVPSVGPYVLGEEADGDVRFVWSPAPARGAVEAAWTGDLDWPLAGRWTFELPHGDRWWEAASFLRWSLPAAVACLAFLLVPTALLIAIRRRRTLDEARARFVNELAHDLRTPVTSLRLHAEMLSEGRVPAGEEKRYLDVLGRETARLSALLANLLDLSRVERGGRAYEARPIDMAEALAEVVGDFKLIHPKRADDVRLDPATGVVALADRTALCRCIANLLDNAGKFTSPGTAIHVAAERADGRVRVVVADEGPGIAPTDRARVFRLYERGAPASTNGAPGTGLGLALVRELAHGMGGGVTLLDSPRGAAFEILLPEAPHG